MFSLKQTADLNAELHGLILRYFPDARPCYRTALLHFTSAICLLFDRYQALFVPPGVDEHEDPLRDPADPGDDTEIEKVRRLLDSPLLVLGAACDPDPKPRAHKQTGRHREPPAPPMS